MATRSFKKLYRYKKERMVLLKTQYRKLFLVAGAVVILDQISKALILATVPLNHSIAVIPGFFNLTHIHNPGGAFGFMADQSSLLRHTVFIFFTIAAIGLIFYLYTTTPDTLPYLQTAFALVFGGALGNLLDRIRFGKVVDFLDLYLGTLHWPAFNVADSAVSIGIAVFLYHLCFKKMPG